MTAALVSAPVQEPQTAPADVIEVVVSLRHIQEGRRRPTDCAVALALKDRGFHRVAVGTIWVGIGAPGRGAAFYNVPPEMAAWIRAFDNGEQVAPERFLLRRAA